MDASGTFPVRSHRASASLASSRASCDLAPVGADKRQGIQRGGSHGLLVALVGHPAALQRVFLGGIPVPGPALQLAEVIQQERQRSLVPTVERVPVAVGQLQPRLVQPVAPFEDEPRDQGRVEHRKSPDRLFGRLRPRAPRPGPAGPAVRRGPGGTRTGRCGPASAPSDADRRPAQPSAATPSPSGRRQAGRRPPAGRTQVPVPHAHRAPGRLGLRRPPGGTSSQRAASRCGGSGSWPAGASSDARRGPAGQAARAHWMSSWLRAMSPARK